MSIQDDLYDESISDKEFEKKHNTDKIRPVLTPLNELDIDIALVFAITTSDKPQTPKMEGETIGRFIRTFRVDTTNRNTDMLYEIPED